MGPSNPSSLHTRLNVDDVVEQVGFSVPAMERLQGRWQTHGDDGVGEKKKGISNGHNYTSFWS